MVTLKSGYTDVEISTGMVAYRMQLHYRHEFLARFTAHDRLTGLRQDYWSALYQSHCHRILESKLHHLHVCESLSFQKQFQI